MLLFGKKNHSSRGVASLEEDDEELQDIYADEEPVVDVPTRVTSIPFSDGIVSHSLLSAKIVSTEYRESSSMLRGFLEYLEAHGAKFGSLTYKPSFMKKKGGRLL